jgi:hypothetical protein
MNPYDFVPIEHDYKPELRRPVWHNVLAPNSAHPEKLYSGELLLDTKTETELFIGTSASSMQGPKHPGEHIRNQNNQVIIPGTSLKGLLRSVVETLCRGCLTVYDNQRYPIPPGFEPCRNHLGLCVACRLFGMMERGSRNARVFLGKVNVEDALAYNGLTFTRPIFTAVLASPKPYHKAFYLKPKSHEGQRDEIAGRKFYFHQQKIQTESRLLDIKKKPGEYRNQYLKPIGKGNWFSGRLTFRNLETHEFAALLLALTLREDAMRYKIGYGKPIGLGSIDIRITQLTLVDYATRYTSFGHTSSHGLQTWGEDALYDLVGEQMASIDPQIQTAWRAFRAQPSLDHLRDIWEWPPDPTVDYCYPSKGWFERNPRARIADTRNLDPGD